MVKKTAAQLEQTWVNKLKGRIGKGKSSASDATLGIYANRIKRVFKSMYPDKPFRGISFIYREPAKVIEFVNNSSWADNSKKDMFVALLASYDPNAKGITANGKNLYKREVNKWLLKLAKEEKKQEKSDRESEKWVTQEQIVEARKKLLDKYLISENIKDMRDYVLFSFYTLLPPRRALDYAKMKVTYDENYDGNALIPTNATARYKKFKKFVFNDFKLAEKKGSETFTREYMLNLPNGREIVDLLDSWILLNPIGYVFLEPRNQKSMSKAVIRVAKRALGKPVNINVFRHMYISNFLKESPFLLNREMISTFMSHSPAQQMLYRRREVNEKFDKEDHLEGFERGEPELKGDKNDG